MYISTPPFLTKGNATNEFLSPRQLLRDAVSSINIHQRNANIVASQSEWETTSNAIGLTTDAGPSGP